MCELDIVLHECMSLHCFASCTKEPKILNPFCLRYVYRPINVTAIYRLSNRESHIRYNAHVLPNMTNPAQLSGGKYYAINN